MDNRSRPRHLHRIGKWCGAQRCCAQVMQRQKPGGRKPMNIHEYQAKQLLRRYGVPVPRGDVAHNPAEAETIAEELDGPVWVVKAQIHAGGRGKAGGVKICRSVKEVVAGADKLLGSRLVTHQTGPQGKEVKKVYIEQGSDIARELYVAQLIDRKTGGVAVIAST